MVFVLLFALRFLKTIDPRFIALRSQLTNPDIPPFLVLGILVRETQTGRSNVGSLRNL